MNLTNLLTVPTEVFEWEENWVQLTNNYPGVAVCINKTGTVVGAIEYFFSAAFIYLPTVPNDECLGSYPRDYFPETLDAQTEEKLL